MPLTLAQLTALKSEITTDPRTYGYAADITSGNDIAIADKLNLRRTGANGGPAITIRRNDVSSAEVAEAVLVTEYTALPGNPTAAQLSLERRYLAWFTAILAAPRIRLIDDAGIDTPVMANFQAMFPAGSGTRNRLAALAIRFGSRAEELFGRDMIISELEVSAARRLA